MRNPTPHWVALMLAVLAAVATVAAALPSQPGFVENLGQWDAQARYHMLVGQTSDDPPVRFELWLTDTGYVYSLQQLPREPGARGAGHAVALRFAGASPAAIEPTGQLPGAHNWLGGNRDVTGAKAYERVVYRGVYPGVDVVFDAVTPAAAMETTWRVAPGADPSAIALAIEGADRVSLGTDGALVLATTLGEVSELRPVAFQTTATGAQEPVPVAFSIEATRVRFAVGEYDRGRELVIDPVVVFSRTFGGSSSESVASMHEDATGRYFTGATASSNYPTSAGAYKTTLGGNSDWFATKFSLDNTTLLWSTYIGGTSYEFGGQSALRSDGQLVIAGSTHYPATYAFPYVYSYGSGTDYYKIAVFRLSADGASRISAAIFGGSCSSYQYGSGVAVNPANGDVYVTGQTYAPQSYGWPWGAGGYLTSGTGYGDPFITRLNADFSQYLNSTMIPADDYYYDTGMYVALDGSGNVYVSGLTYAHTSWAGTNSLGTPANYDLFVAKYNADLTSQYYDTRIGGSSTDPTVGYSMTSMPDYYYETTGEGLVVDGSGRAWVTGMTASTDWPTTTGAYRTTNAGNYDVFVTCLNAAGNALVYSTLIGGSSTDGGRAIAFDSIGNVYVAGLAASNNYPTTAGAPQQTYGGSYEWVLSVFNPDLSQLLLSTYWGGTSAEYGEALVLGPDYAARIAGVASSSAAFPQVPGGSSHFGTAGGYDGGVASFDLRADLRISKTTGVAASWWLISVTNAGAQGAAFTGGQVILVDNLPAADYGPTEVQNAVNVTNPGNIACAIVSNTLTCTASGATVTIGGGGGFEVYLPFTSGASSLTNPAGVLQVDPNGVLTEAEEGNNSGGATTWNRVVVPVLGSRGLAILASLIAAAALIFLRRTMA